MAHEFHFKLNGHIRSRLCRTEVFGRIGTFSGTFRWIIGFMAPVIRREEKWGKQRESRYLFVAPGCEEGPDDVHVYLEEEAYRQLKMLHHDLDFYSIAQLVRFLIGVFLDLEDIYGVGVVEYLKWIFRRWEKEERAQNSERVLRQLLRFHIKFLLKSGQTTIYDREFKPLLILRP